MKEKARFRVRYDDGRVVVVRMLVDVIATSNMRQASRIRAFSEGGRTVFRGDAGREFTKIDDGPIEVGAKFTDGAGEECCLIEWS